MPRWPGINVLHVLDHSLPEQSGYAYRSHAILRELQQQGLALDVITSPKHGETHDASSEIDGITYQRTTLARGAVAHGVIGQIRTVRSTKKRIAELVKAKSARLIHAHSPCLNGLASLGHGIPLIYEMRSSWEDAAVSVGTTKEGSPRYRLSKMLESHVVRKADAIVVICEGLRRELLERGIAEDKITVVPNALPVEMFDLPEPDAVASVRERYKLKGAKIIGFFGSFFEWEGVDQLVRVLPGIVRAVPGAHLLLAGGGRQEHFLRDLVAKLGLEERVTFAGRVGHAEIKAFYCAADVMAFPRVSDRLTNMVTPIKPLEAMAQGTIAVASDVGGHRELIRHEETGLLYPAGNGERLAEALTRALSSEADLQTIRMKARNFVEAERQWSNVAKSYIPLYDAYGLDDG